MGQHIKRGMKALRVGFVPLCDCAPLIMARELGLFERYGLDVKLSREIGWATLRDKLLYGELDAAHALAPMIFAATLGLESAIVPCLTGLVLNLHGDAITLSASLCGEPDDRDDWREHLLASKERLVFGIPFLYSAHHFVARTWLRGLGANVANRTQFVVVPPPQMPENLRAGHLDGYCVGEPWNSLAVLAGSGRIVASSAEIAPLHPEKILMVRADFARNRSSEHELLIASLIEACRYCDQSRNRGAITETLARREFLNVPPDALRLAFGQADDKQATDRHKDFTIFAHDNANEPSGRKAAWVIENLRHSGLCRDSSALDFALAKRVFRNDIFQRALRLCEPANLGINHENESRNEAVALPI